MPRGPEIVTGVHVKLALYVAVALLVATIAAVMAGTVSWHQATASAVDALHALASESAPSTKGELPEPVARYFRNVFDREPSTLRQARLTQVGTFRVSENEDGWRPFEATQYVVTEPPGFVWDARIAMAPGIATRVRDAYFGGAGSMHVTLVSLFTLVEEKNRDELDRGALQRYLAEAVWFPTALLPSARLRWEAVDETTAEAFLSDANVEVSAQFRFSDDGDIVGVYADRYRELDGSYVLTPWRGRFRSHETRDGVRIPTEGEVAWILPEGEYLYWRARIVDIEYARW